MEDDEDLATDLIIMKLSQTSDCRSLTTYIEIVLNACNHSMFILLAEASNVSVNYDRTKGEWAFHLNRVLMRRGYKRNFRIRACIPSSGGVWGIVYRRNVTISIQSCLIYVAIKLIFNCLIQNYLKIICMFRAFTMDHSPIRQTFKFVKRF